MDKQPTSAINVGSGNVGRDKLTNVGNTYYIQTGVDQDRTVSSDLLFYWLIDLSASATSGAHCARGDA